MNVADSEVVASIMQMDGYELTDRIEEADAIFVNTCSVRDNAEQKIYGRCSISSRCGKRNMDWWSVCWAVWPNGCARS